MAVAAPCGEQAFLELDERRLDAFVPETSEMGHQAIHHRRLESGRRRQKVAQARRQQGLGVGIGHHA